MRKASRLEKGDIEAYICFLEELGTEGCRPKAIAAYAKGANCNSIFRLRFDGVMLESNYAANEVHQALLEGLYLAAQGQTRTCKDRTSRVFMAKCLDLYFSKEESTCVGRILGLGEADINRDTMADLLAGFFTSSSEQ